MAHLKKIIALGMTAMTVASLMPVTSLAAYYGWVQKDDGKWYYYDYYGKKVKYDSVSRYDSGSESDTPKYYVLNSKGAQVTTKGWYTTNYFYTYYGNKIKFQYKYYLKSDGSCTTGWKKISGKWYYFEYDGKMVKNTSANKPDSNGEDRYYLLGSDGKRITKKGWHQVTVKDLDDVNGEINSYKIWFYVKTDGTLARNCTKKIGKKQYLFHDDGVLVQNWYYGVHDKDHNIKYYYAADKNGAVITKKGKYTLKYKVQYPSYMFKGTVTRNCVVYVKTGGKLHTGWKTIKGKKYYFDPDAYRCTTMTENGVKYYFGKTGSVTKEIKQAT